MFAWWQVDCVLHGLVSLNNILIRPGLLDFVLICMVVGQAELQDCSIMYGGERISSDPAESTEG
jgi:hypothetical protein